MQGCLPPAFPPLPESQLPRYYRWQKVASPTSSPGLLYQLTAVRGEGRFPGPVTWSPPRGGRGPEGPGRSRLDWTGRGGEDRMSFLAARSLPGKAGTAGRRTGGHGADSGSSLPSSCGFGMSWSTLHAPRISPPALSPGLECLEAGCGWDSNRHKHFCGRS